MLTTMKNSYASPFITSFSQRFSLSKNWKTECSLIFFPSIHLAPALDYGCPIPNTLREERKEQMISQSFQLHCHWRKQLFIRYYTQRENSRTTGKY